MERVSISKWIEKFNNGDFINDNVITQCNAGWYDWFCKDKLLKNKTKFFGNIIKKLKSSSKLDLDSTYVWFKNCCPLQGKLYDQFKISDLNTHEVLYCINYKDEYEDADFAVYSRKTGFENPIFKCNKAKELIDWFND